MTANANFHRAEEDAHAARVRVEEDIEALGREIHHGRVAAGTKLRDNAFILAAGAVAIALVAVFGGKRAVMVFLAAASISSAGVWYALKKASA